MSAPRRAAGALLYLASGVWLLAYLLLEMARALYFEGYFADGAFQVFDPLRRIAAGQAPGVDFQVFHGVLLPYLHDPIFRLAGGTIFASELSRALVSFALHPAVLGFYFYALTRDARRALFLTAVAVALTAPVGALYEPRNSLSGVRATAPLLVAGALLLSGPGLRAALVAGSLLGAALLCSVEQGVAVVAAYLLVDLVLALRAADRPRALLRTGAAAVCAGVVFTGVVLLLGDRAGLAAVLEYHFRTLPAEQFWYFGAPPNGFYATWVALLGEPYFTGPLLVAAGILGITLRFLAARGEGGEDQDRRAARAILVLTLSGAFSMAAMLGIAGPRYAPPMLRVLVVCVLTLVMRPRVIGAERWLDRHGAVVARLRAGALALLALCELGWTAHTLVHHGESIPRAVAAMGANPFAWRGALGANWERFLAQSTRLIGPAPSATGATGAPGRGSAPTPTPAPDTRAQGADRRSARPQPPLLWSTYAGLLEARYGVFHPATDYIIHALGPEGRRAYEERFRALSPTWVQTLDPLAFPYEEWLRDDHWGFYEQVLADYDLAGRVEWAFLWRRTGRGSLGTATATAPIRLAAGATSVALPANPFPRAALAVVRLDYQVVTPWRAIPFFGRLPRYLVEMRGARNTHAVSLPPYQGEFTFPVFLAPRARAELVFTTGSLLSGASYRVRGATLRFVELRARNRLFLSLTRDQRAEDGPGEPR